MHGRPVKNWFGALRERIDLRFETLVSDPEWQAQASLKFLTRFAARRRARALFDLCAGFTYSQTLVACERLGLIDFLLGSPASLTTIARHTNTNSKALSQLLQAACALDVLRLHNGNYRLGAMGSSLAGNPGVRAMIAHHAYLYADLAMPEKLLAEPPQSGALKSYWAYAGAQDSNSGSGSTEQVSDYSELMARSQRFIADQVMAGYDFSRVSRVLDLGGGHGAFIRALAARYTHLHFELFDLPAVIAEARRYLTQEGVADRVTFTAGDLFRDSLPEGADLVTLVRVLHDHDDEFVTGLLPRIRSQMAPTASLLIAEPMAGGAAQGIEAYFANYFLAMGQGKLREFAQLKEMAERAGFTGVGRKPTPVPMLVELLAAKP